MVWQISLTIEAERGVIISPILQKEKPRHMRSMTCQDHTTGNWQTQDPNPSSLTRGPGPGPHLAAALGLGVQKTKMGWGANGGEKNEWEYL